MEDGVANVPVFEMLDGVITLVGGIISEVLNVLTLLLVILSAEGVVEPSAQQWVPLGRQVSESLMSVQNILLMNIQVSKFACEHYFL